MWTYTLAMATATGLAFYVTFRWAARPRTTRRSALIISVTVFAAMFLMSSLANLASGSVEIYGEAE